MAELGERYAEGGIIDLRDTGLRYTLDVLGRTVFGADITGAAQTLRRTLPMLSDHATRRGLAPIRIPARWPTPANRRADQARGELNRVVDGYIAERRRGEKLGDDLMSRLLSARDLETDALLDDQEVRDQVLNLLVGGHETSAATLAFSLHLVAKYPDVQDRIREEIHRVAGVDGPIGPDELLQLRYTNQVIDEAMRLLPPGHTLVRRAKVDTELTGRKIPAGRIVAVSVWGIHHNPEVWPDPYVFDPDRFTDEAAQGRDRYAHLPFGGGPRSCIGSHLALAELVIAVATVVRSCLLRSMVDSPPLDAKVTLRPAETVPCWVEPRNPRSN